MVTELGPAEAGEILTLQRAAFVTEAQAHHDPHLPPLTQTLTQLSAELGEPSCHGWGIREEGRLIACVRAHVSGDTAELRRLAVAPDRQGQGLGTVLLLAAEDLVPPQVQTIRLFTSERSHGNLRLYRRHGYQPTHTVAADGYRFVHLAKSRPGQPGAVPRQADRS
jgi:GNAT superfamily N-acetyltransferase